MRNSHPKEPRVLGILPARSGSKGIPQKNLREVAGKPLLHWAAEALAGSNVVNFAVCSTDSRVIADLASDVGLAVPFLRTEELANDTSNVIDSVRDMVERLSINQRFEHVVLVQATSPTVTSTDVEMALKLCVSEGLDVVISAVRMPPSQNPALAFFGGNSRVESWLVGSEAATLRRQDFPTVFRRTGLIYVFRVDHLMSKAQLYTGRTGFIEIENERAISIDDEDDLAKAEAYLLKKSS